MIEGNSGFAYKRAIKYAGKNSGWSHMDDDDILQASLLGLIHAVDRYDPDRQHGTPPRSYSFTTYAHFWIMKLIDEEISANHWNTLRPPRKLMRDFLYRKFDYDASGEYISRFMSQSSVDDTDHGQYLDKGFGHSEIRDIIERCKLSPVEQRVFSVIYGDNVDQDDLCDLSKKEISEIEEDIIERMRSHFE